MRSILMTILFIGSVAKANVELANNGQAITCHAEDNQSWFINASRTKMKYTVEGESLGLSKIYKTKVDGKNAVIYKSKVGTLTLMNDRSLFEFKGEDYTSELDCE